MAAVNFPNPNENNPDTGLPYSAGWYNDANGVTYEFTNGIWSATKTPGADFNNTFVLQAGDNMTGALTIGPDGGPVGCSFGIDGATTLSQGQVTIKSDGQVDLGRDSGQLLVRGDSRTDASPAIAVYRNGWDPTDETFRVQYDGTVKIVGGTGGIQPLVISDGSGGEIDVRERLTQAKETFQQLKQAVQDAVDFDQLKASLLEALADYEPSASTMPAPEAKKTTRKRKS